jgi:hypothetical protein
MAQDFTVVKHGVDTSGRAIYMTRYMQLWWEDYCEELGFAPIIVQGAFMTRNGGGADASAGYHDEAGCLDLRVWDRTEDEVAKMVRAGRRRAAATWVRDERHGMDPHLHLVLGPDRPLASGAAYQWNQYVAGRDGLAGNGSDYHWRPSPLVGTWEPDLRKPTPNITAALQAKDAGTRRNALERIVRNGEPAMVRAAKAYLAAMTAMETARGKAAAARAKLKGLEVR